MPHINDGSPWNAQKLFLAAHQVGDGVRNLTLARDHPTLLPHRMCLSEERCDQMLGEDSLKQPVEAALDFDLSSDKPTGTGISLPQYGQTPMRMASVADDSPPWRSAIITSSEYSMRLLILEYSILPTAACK